MLHMDREFFKLLQMILEKRLADDYTKVEKNFTKQSSKI